MQLGLDLVGEALVWVVVAELFTDGAHFVPEVLFALMTAALFVEVLLDA